MSFVLILFGFVRRGVSNNFGIFLVRIGGLSRWILWRMSRVELLDTREQL